jgi:hypothetical protein
MKSDRRSQPSSAGGSLSRPNDDNSVMFSLKTLAAKAEPTVSASQPASMDDSGLIDLKKLMANAGASDQLPPVLFPDEAGLFALPEETLAPQVVTAPDESADVQGKAMRGRGKWLAAILMTVSAGAGMGVLHTRSKDVPQLEARVAAAAERAASEQRKFVAAPPGQDTSPSVANVVPTPEDTTAKVVEPVATFRGRRAVVSPPSRDRSKQDVPAKTKTETKQPPPEPCDLMCEIERAARKKR